MSYEPNGDLYMIQMDDDTHRKVVLILNECHVCRSSQDAASHYTVDECEEELGRPCQYPDEHHEYLRSGIVVA